MNLAEARTLPLVTNVSLPAPRGCKRKAARPGQGILPVSQRTLPGASWGAGLLLGVCAVFLALFFRDRDHAGQKSLQNAVIKLSFAP
jgi:hypothetical protein